MQMKKSFAHFCFNSFEENFIAQMPAISVTNLRKHYGTAYVLKGIDFSFEPGQVIGYIGPNGAGKSTTIKILTGIIPEFEGEANILGLDIRKQSLEIKQRIGYIPEQAAIYEVLTPLEYLTFIGRLYHLDQSVINKKASELLRIFELADKADMRMNGFSKGMKQKVLLISGLMHNPEIIFLDEPLSGLDANAVILVKEILSQLKQTGKTIFYSSHIMDVVEKISDHIIIIDQGKIIADGTFETLKDKARSGSLESVFTALTGHQEYNSIAGEFVDILKN